MKFSQIFQVKTDKVIMLIEFSVGNYRSFKDKVTLSMVAANIVAKDKKLDENKPTIEQLKQQYRICQSLCQMFIPIYLITLDNRTKDLFILAGNEIEVTISPKGDVDYP